MEEGMQVTAEERDFLEALRRLAPGTVAQLAALALRLAALGPEVSTDWSDAWSDEDLRDFSRASLERFDREHGNEPS